MGHNITAIIIGGEYNKEIAKEYDLRGVELEYELTMFLIDNYYISYWQHALDLDKHLKISPPHDLLMPTEEAIAHAIAHIVEKIASTDKQYALIHTDYWGGKGKQYAAILKGRQAIAAEVETINDALRHLGVKREDGKDEFDSLGLSQYKASPTYLDKYSDLCNELGL